MKLEKLNYGRERIRKMFLYGVICVVVLLITITFLTSKAKYRYTESVPLVKGKISYKMADLNVLAMYVNEGDGNYNELSKDALMPDASLYVVNEEVSYCYKETSSEHDNNVKIYTENGNHIIYNLSKNDKCYLYFDKQEARLMEDILEDYYIYKKIRTTGTFNEPISGETVKAIYIGEEEEQATYYFAGNPIDNWMKFAGYYWRIIRINGNGSIRIIYQGTEANAKGEDTQIGTSYFNSGEDGDNSYVGYFYKLGEQRGLEIPSTIYTYLSNWFLNSNLVRYFDKIDTNAGFCGDRTAYTDENGTIIGGGIGTTQTYYGPYLRVSIKYLPTFNCADSNDLYTYKAANNGNKVLSVPVGLITVDELLFGGISPISSLGNCDNYLCTEQNYWTFSPAYFGNNGISSDHAWLYLARPSGYIGIMNAVLAYGVRPVINIRSDVKFIGNGTISNPYEII